MSNDANPPYRPIDQLLAGLHAADGSAEIDIAERRAAMKELGPLNPALPDVHYAQEVIAGVPCESVLAPAASAERMIIYVHGGGYIGGAAHYYRGITGEMSRAADATVLAIDYQLAPEHPFPAALDDVTAVYREVSAAPRQLAIAGDSAGGGLSLALMQTLASAGLRMPDAAWLMSPWGDMRPRDPDAPSRDDPLITPELVQKIADLYLDGHDASDPRCSPVMGDFSRLPPMLVQVGSRELLLEDSLLIDRRARAAGATVTLEVWPEMIHVWQVFQTILPEARNAIQRGGRWLDALWRPR